MTSNSVVGGMESVVGGVFVHAPNSEEGIRAPPAAESDLVVFEVMDGFRKNDHEQILSCLTDDIKWTVFGAFHLTGKEAYDKAIDGAPDFIDPPELEVVWPRRSSCATARSPSAVHG